MKKVLLFVLATLFAYAMNAQTLLSEGFESGIPATWSTIDNDGDGNNWGDGSTILAGWGYSASSYAHTGSSMAMSLSYDNDSGESYDADNYLVTPQLSIPAGGATLKFYVASITSAYPDDYMVKLSTSGNSAANFTVTLQDLTSASNSWDEIEIDLSSYAGQNVYIAFVHQSYDMLALMLDDVTVIGISSTPEIALTQLTFPTNAVAGSTIDITGTVMNNSSTALTSFSLTYTVDGTPASTITIDGLNIANGGTYNFTHTVPATITAGTHTVVVTVSNPNGTADNTADNSLSASVLGCDAATAPFAESFNSGFGCWQAIDNDGDGYNWMRASELIETMGWSTEYMDALDNASGDALVSESYRNGVGAFTADNWLISPAIVMPSSGTFKATWYDKAGDSGYPDSYSVYVGTSADIATLSASTPAYEGASAAEFTQREIVLPDYAGQTIYIAFQHSDNDMYYLILDEFAIEEMSTTPEIALSSITTPAGVVAGSNVNVSGIATNNSAAALTSFDVVYTFDGTASATYNVTGINVAAGETYAFTHNAPITNIAAGEHTLVVTVSNPNGVADVTTDNSLTLSMMACASVDAPFAESFDDADFGCWQAIDADGDGHNWVHVSELLSDPTAASSYSYNGTADCLMSYSYMSQQSFDPDNWLISPAINIPATGTYAAQWYAKNYTTSYADSYSVYIANSSDIASLTAAGSVMDDTPDDEYEVKTLMLNAYAGQTIYIAFRHHDSYDKYYMFFDEFSIESVSIDPEITLTSVAAPSQVAMNTAYVVNGTVINKSATPLTSFDVACTVNGETVNQNITVSNLPYMQSYSFAVDMPGIAAANTYDVTMTVSNPNGVADITTDNTQTTSVNIYDANTSVPRIALLENLTGSWCGYCPAGHQRIEQALANGYEDKVIWVAHHVTDNLSMDVTNTLDAAYGYAYAPATMLDRTYWNQAFAGDGEGGISDGPIFFPSSDIADGFAAAVAQPAFVTVNISNVNYNATTRALSFTVSGNVTGALGTTDARLNAWLLEDGLVADGQTGVGHGPTQTDNYNLYNPFVHNHVIRESLSGDAWGDAGVVTATAGSNYTKTYTTTVSNNYDASKCYIVAFVSNGNHSNINDCRVFNAGKSAYLSAGDTPGPQPQGIDDVNANDVKLYPNPTNGNLYIEVEGLQKVEVIDAVGRVVMSQNNGNVVNMSNLANGIYTVRVMANGNTAVKKVVKK